MDINQVWPEWNEDCVLGEGSFGKVYRAKRVEYGRVFYSAIKVLTVPKSQQEIKFARSQGMNDGEIYQYFRSLVDNLLNEIALMDNLKGAKNIVGIEDYKIVEREGEIGWDIFIRMELLTPFDSFVSNPEFSQIDVIRLGVDLCSALEICEQNYIVHRDIKPDNIFISRFGEYKLGDFGIARKMEASQANLSRKGTLNYMAPEVYKSEEYGSNVDIYSLGLVLYTLLNNNRVAFLPPYPQPIAYKDNEEALSKRLSGMPLPLPCNASPALGAVILKACAYRPQDRYQTATEFKNALIQEWNALAQSGENRGIQPGTVQMAPDLDQRLQSTTNDMTSNGRLVVDAYTQETTVLDQPGNMYAYQGQNAGQPQIPVAYSTAKSNKLCRVLAWPLALLLCVLVFLPIERSGPAILERIASVCLLGIGLIILLADNAKHAVGVSVMALSAGHLVTGLAGLLDGVQDGIPVSAVVALVAGLLLLFGGVVIVCQKEVRFGGALCFYGTAVMWLYQVYCLINGGFDMDTWQIFVSVAAVTVFIWSYGYNSDEKRRGIRLILSIVGYALAAVVMLYTVVLAAKSTDIIIDMESEASAADKNNTIDRIEENEENEATENNENDIPEHTGNNETHAPENNENNTPDAGEEHIWGEWLQHNDGQHKRTCSCGEVEYATHSWNDGERGETTEGIVVTYICMICGCAEQSKKNYVDSGECGANISWTLDENGTLIISGTGKMTDYHAEKAPWYSYRDVIVKAEIANGITSVGSGTFTNCENLTSVNIPGSVTRIGENAFSFCKSLTEVTIPKSVITIGAEVFLCCPQLERILVENGNSNYSNDTYGVLFSKEQDTLICVPGALSGEYVVPDGVTTIGVSAFYHCTKLESVTISNSISHIDEFAFAHCNGLTDIVIPDSVVYVGGYAFSGCTNLSRITIGSGVTVIDRSASEDCVNLKYVYYSGTEEQWDTIYIAENNDWLLNANRISRETPRCDLSVRNSGYRYFSAALRIKLIIYVENLDGDYLEEYEVTIRVGSPDGEIIYQTAYGSVQTENSREEYIMLDRMLEETTVYYLSIETTNDYDISNNYWIVIVEQPRSESDMNNLHSFEEDEYIVTENMHIYHCKGSNCDECLEIPHWYPDENMSECVLCGMKKLEAE